MHHRVKFTRLVSRQVVHEDDCIETSANTVQIRHREQLSEGGGNAEKETEIKLMHFARVQTTTLVPKGSLNECQQLHREQSVLHFRSVLTICPLRTGELGTGKLLCKQASVQQAGRQFMWVCGARVRCLRHRFKTA
ncbi:unnamed protein product [Dibothriocephalus latus]|uniref:Uncharacterized protein n=1 Tax=Dibothriocephalus latus TaxID=60516 RepID=A0A3P7MAR6_DIBLA|nr:unnamed protein product [Dibothriocephalus latus]